MMICYLHPYAFCILLGAYCGSFVSLVIVYCNTLLYDYVVTNYDVVASLQQITCTG